MAVLGKAQTLGDKEAPLAESLERMEWPTQQGARGTGDDGHQSVLGLRLCLLLQRCKELKTA